MNRINMLNEINIINTNTILTFSKLSIIILGIIISLSLLLLYGINTFSLCYIVYIMLFLLMKIFSTTQTSGFLWYVFNNIGINILIIQLNILFDLGLTNIFYILMIANMALLTGQTYEIICEHNNYIYELFFGYFVSVIIKLTDWYSNITSYIVGILIYYIVIGLFMSFDMWSQFKDPILIKNIKRKYERLKIFFMPLIILPVYPLLINNTLELLLFSNIFTILNTEVHFNQYINNNVILMCTLLVLCPNLVILTTIVVVIYVLYWLDILYHKSIN